MSEKFESMWCVLEIMGHARFAGLLSEQTIAGCGFIRLDVPEVALSTGQTMPAFTKLFGPSSVYAISPCTEETAIAFLKKFRSRAFSEYEAPRLTVSESSHDPYEGDPDEDDFGT